MSEKSEGGKDTLISSIACHSNMRQSMALSTPSSWPNLPTLISTGRHVMCKVQHTIFQPTGPCSLALLAKSRVNTSPALLGLLREGVLFAIGLRLAPGTAVFHTADAESVFVAKVVPVRQLRFAGQYLGHHIFFEHVAVCQHVRALQFKPSADSFAMLPYSQCWTHVLVCTYPLLFEVPYTRNHVRRHMVVRNGRDTPLP